MAQHRTSQHRRRSTARVARRRPLWFEPLENRRVLAVLAVSTLEDVVDLEDGVTSLREAIFAANTLPGADTIEFEAALFADGPGTILLTQGELAITDSLTILGPGAHLLTIDARGSDPTPDEKLGDGSRLFSINDFDDAAPFLEVVIQGVTLTGGDVIGNGGAIYSRENLTLIDSVVSGNAALGDPAFNSGRTYGGGILSIYGSLTVTGSTISQNTAVTNGGGIDFNTFGRQGSAMTIAGSTISHNRAANQGGGIQFIGPGAISDSTISNNTGGFGGGIHVRGFRGQLTISNTAIIDNTAARGGGLEFNASGGVGGRVQVFDSLIAGNSASGFGGGAAATSLGGSASGSLELHRTAIVGNSAASGGGLYFALATAVADNCTIEANGASDGGGIYLSSGTVRNSMIIGNTAQQDGGGIYATAGTVTHSTIAQNLAGRGGGIYSSSSSTFFGPTLNSSTVSGNLAASRGGGVQNGNGLLTIQFSTITSNEAPNGQGSGANSTPPFSLLSIRTAVASTIIAGNVNSDVDYMAGGNPFQSDGYNLVGTGNAVAAFNKTGDQTAVIAPRLGPLLYNGGPTMTHALLPDSPAIDRGSPLAVAGSGSTPLYDQRGDPFGRVVDGDGVGGARIDIGAFERQPNPLAGDYNFDLTVDAADYVLWRKSLGSTHDLRADGNENGVVDLADHGMWRENFGTWRLPPEPPPPPPPPPSPPTPPGANELSEAIDDQAAAVGGDDEFAQVATYGVPFVASGAGHENQRQHREGRQRAKSILAGDDRIAREQLARLLAWVPAKTREAELRAYNERAEAGVSTAAGAEERAWERHARDLAFAGWKWRNF